MGELAFGRELHEDERVPGEAYVVGEQPWWDPRRWPALVASSRSLRAQLRRARNKGVAVRVCPPAELAEGTPLRTDVERLVARWLRTRHMAPLSYVARVAPLERLHERHVVVAERDGQVLGVAVLSPTERPAALLVEHVLRAADAPNGTAELLVDACMRLATTLGASEVTLGLAPLTGRVPRVLAWVRKLTRGLFDFHGLSEFKAKLKPERWRRVLVEHPGQGAFMGTVRVLRWFAGGSLTRFAILSALRGPPPLIRAVALALIPWTVGLALVDDRWFPAPWMRPAWVAFDVVLCVALFWLARRINRRHRRVWLHRALAAVVALDAVVTTTQALSWNAAQITGAGDAAILVLACAAPAAVAALLASSLRYRER